MFLLVYSGVLGQGTGDAHGWEYAGQCFRMREFTASFSQQQQTTCLCFYRPPLLHGLGRERRTTCSVVVRDFLSLARER